MNEIKTLTFFRFLTAFIVFCFHAKIHLNVCCGIDIIDRFVQQGAIFMSAFFVLSGFVLTFSYINNDFTQQSNRKNFYIKRIAKIYPAYFVALLLSYIFFNNTTFAQGIVMIPMIVLCLQSLFFSTFPYLLNGGMWSSVEAFFYLFFPIIVEAFKKCAQYHKVILIISYLFTLYPSIVQCYFGGTTDLYVNPLFRLPEFVVGMCIAYIYLQNESKKKKNGFLIIFSFATFIVLVGVLSKNQFLNHCSFNNNYCYYNCIVFPFMSFLMYELAVTKSKFVLKITDNRLSNYLGRISYSFYLTQFLAIGVIGKKYLNNLGFISFISTFLLNIFFAVLMYEFIEKRCQKKIKEHFLIKT